MDVVALVERARAGDVDAFTELVRHHQSLAYGCAVAMIHDFDGAYDHVPENAFHFVGGIAEVLDRTTGPESP